MNSKNEVEKGYWCKTCQCILLESELASRDVIEKGGIEYNSEISICPHCGEDNYEAIKPRILTPEEIFNKHLTCNPKAIFKELVCEAMKEYGDLRATEMRDKALGWAAANAHTKLTSTGIVIDKDSILSGKTEPELSI